LITQLQNRKSAPPDVESEERISSGQSGCQEQEVTGLTFDEYARAKALPVDFLKSLGVSQSTFGGKLAVRIPYFGTLGEPIAVRFRIKLEGDRFRWESGSKLCLYGQNRLADAQQAGYVVLVEGESDCHTLWFHGIPAVGVPGAANWREDRDASQLDGIEIIYVVIEPDRGGEIVCQWLARSRIRDRVKLIRLPEKDPSSLYLERPSHFLAQWEIACREAIPWTAVDGEMTDEERPEKPRLLVEPCNPDCTVEALRDIIATAGILYDRGVPVRLAYDKLIGGTLAHPITPDALILMVHRMCRPRIVRKGEEVDARLPRNVAVMYLDWRGEWQLPPLNGIASAPMLREDGIISSAQGYDITTGMWLENVPDMASLVPERPTEEDAQSALLYLRETFKTFCFADAEAIQDPDSEIAVVDTTKPPGKDESAFLTALLTAVCRPSLHLAPGLLLRGAPLSGAGAGKGLLARCICIIAFGREPHAVTGGGTAEELEKRIAAELIEGSPALFLDNMNNVALRSDLLASAITERPARVRLLGRTQMVPLNASAMVILTGNGLTVSEDLARRFLAVDLDPGTEDPEARRFTTDIRMEVTKNRNRLLAAALSIWRWGRLGANLGRIGGNIENEDLARVEPGNPVLAPVVGQSAMMGLVSATDRVGVDHLAKCRGVLSDVHGDQFVGTIADALDAEGPDIDELFLALDLGHVGGLARLVGQCRGNHGHEAHRSQDRGCCLELPPECEIQHGAISSFCWTAALLYAGGFARVSLQALSCFNCFG
jgi:hypothetical protein